MNNFINNQRLSQIAGVNFDSEKIQPGRIVYSRTHTVKKQFKRLVSFPSCVLITSFSDDCCTDEMADKLPSNVRRWFSNNVMTDNPRVTEVPIGIPYSDKEKPLRKVMEEGRNPQHNLVYMNFIRKIHRPINPRQGLYEMFENKSWVTTEGGNDHVSPLQFFNQIVSHPFILSPPGAGPDCHRHWEALYLGSIPIVKRSPVTKILNDLPCLQIDSWDEVTEERLLKELPELQKRFNDSAMDKIWFEYWQKQILEA